MSWGPWTAQGVPAVGAYVQVETRHAVTAARRTQEGLIGGSFGSVRWFDYELPQLVTDWQAVRWRERLHSSPSATHQQRETELA